jgi:Flp pilus assembly protein TadG
MHLSNPIRRPGKTRPRRGAITLEAILTLPVLVIVVLAAIQFGIVMLVREAVSQAAIVAAREAAKEANLPNPNELDDANTAVLNAVNTILGVFCLAVDPTSTDVNSDTKVILEFGVEPPIVTGDPGLLCSPPSSPLVAADEVRVTVCVEMTAGPMLNLLKAFDSNLDVSSLHFQSSAHVKKE